MTDSLSELKTYPPVVVGATGGSGTRLVAEILQATGCYMGRNRNHAQDNMDFAFCAGGRFRWLRRYFPFDGDHPSARQALALFMKLYFGEKKSLSDRLRVFRIGLEYLRPSEMRVVKSQPLKERFRSVAGLFKSKNAAKEDVSSMSCTRWGFKSPISIFLLNPILDFFPGARFIHVVRDGRDMAVSANQRQVKLYSSLFGISNTYSIQNSFELWSSINTWAHKLCSERMEKENYLVVPFESLCGQPRQWVDRIVEFAGLAGPVDDAVYQMPREIDSMGRWRQDPAAFDGLDTEALRLFGYEEQ